ncbi:hypothetical protein B0H99_11076 [Planomicrobium soli]|uniref:Uncharacterized protein n=1 Tax=Planomicrobium soli TaxID=1176648 RepID=A0A2P8GG43_9BACL|nr:hypothetical protein B0H99_11076 [Planomicrobium soli]
MIKDYITDYKKPVLVLPEGTGAYFSDGYVKIIGIKPAFIFKEKIKEELLPSSIQSLRLLS